MNFNQAFVAGAQADFFASAEFFRLLSCRFPVTVIYYRAGVEISRAEGVTEGYAERFTGAGFDRAAIINGATAQTVQAVARAGSDVRYDRPPTGDVAITNTGGAFSHTAPAAVGVASAQLLAANALRRYLLIENKHASNTLYVRLDGAAATVASGITLLPGDSLEVSGYAPTGAVTAIASAAGTSVLVVEG